KLRQDQAGAAAANEPGQRDERKRVESPDKKLKKPAEALELDAAQNGERAVELAAQPGVEIDFELRGGVMRGGGNLSTDERRDGEVLAIVEGAREKQRFAGEARVVIKSESDGGEQAGRDGPHNPAQRKRLIASAKAQHPEKEC